jgi:hypothetical protein
VASYTVVMVRKEWPHDRRYEHVERDCPGTVSYYTRQDVVSIVNDSHTWKTNAGGIAAGIRNISSCSYDSCLAKSQIKTNHNTLGLDNPANLAFC